MKQIVFATNNKNKLAEVREMLQGSDIEILSLENIGCNEDIEETGKTLLDNALLKAIYVCLNYNIACFADDTGLEVEALNGAPGVYSARYAGGNGHDSELNMAKLLAELEGETNRKARFRTVIAYAKLYENDGTDEFDKEILLESPIEIDAIDAPELDKKIEEGENINRSVEIKAFEGIVNGDIIEEKRGTEGFGYDPIFRPEGYTETFAELGHEVKNKISHRAKAVAQLIEYLLNEE